MKKIKLRNAIIVVILLLIASSVTAINYWAWSPSVDTQGGIDKINFQIFCNVVENKGRWCSWDGIKYQPNCLFYKEILRQEIDGFNPCEDI